MVFVGRTPRATRGDQISTASMKRWCSPARRALRPAPGVYGLLASRGSLWTPSRCLSTSASGADSDGVVLAFADGASRGNPGRSGCGALLRDPVSDRVIASATQYLGEKETNNSAEYRGLLLALQLARQHDATRVHIHMDSELVVRQMQGRYRVKAANLRVLYEQAKQACAEMDHVAFSHVRREDNSAADALANQAIDSVDSAGRAS
jgi:ribonuclease HI